MNFFSRLVVKYAGWWFTLALIVTGIASYYTFRLYQNLRTDLEELLPTTARSVIDLHEVTSRLESIDNIDVLVFSEDVEASRRFVEDLAARLEKVPKDTLAWVEYRIKKEIDFFKKRQALYLGVEDLQKVRDYVKQRINYERELYNPLNIVKETELPEPRLDLNILGGKVHSNLAYYTRFPDGYYATEDEKIRVLLAYLPGKVSGISAAVRLREAIDEAVAELNPASYAPDLRVAFSGGVQNLIEEHFALISDLGISSLVVLFLVTTVLILFFRSFLATGALLFSLLAGTIWALGISFFVVGYLNANSAFLGSIVIGNGINFGIILLARYIEERRRRRNHLRAIDLAITKTASATFAAALGAALAYGCLMMTAFRGFKQFGIIGFIGMVMCWVAAYTILPAFLTVVSRFGVFARSEWPERKAFFSTAVAGLVRTRAKPILVFSVVLSIVSVFTFDRFGEGMIETNLLNLRNKESVEKGSAYLSKYTSQVFGRYKTPVVFLPDSKEDAKKIVEKLRERREQEGKDTLIDVVSFIDDFVPEEQAEKIRMLGEIRGMLTPQILSALTKEDRDLVSNYLTSEAFESFEVSDLPEILKNKFREKDGAIGKLVLVEPPISEKTRQANHLISFIAGLREAADEVRPRTAVAGQLAVSSDMIEAIRKDGPLATLFALISVVLLVIVLFRNPRMVSLVLVSLFVGVLWVFGILLGNDWKVNFVNFIALPMTFGIGVDYAVNIFQRYRLEGTGSILKVIRETGGAVALASLTTIIGYGSLLLAKNQGFVSFAKLSVLGEFTCLFTALLTVPAWIYLMDRKRAMVSTSQQITRDPELKPPAA